MSLITTSILALSKNSIEHDVYVDVSHSDVEIVLTRQHKVMEVKIILTRR